MSNSAYSHCYREFNDQYWTESREPSLQEADDLLRKGARSGMPDFISWFYQKSQINDSMSANLRQVAKGFDYKVGSFKSYDVNGCRFHTVNHELSRPSRKTTNSGVFTLGADEVEYYGKIEEIFELHFSGNTPLKIVVFKFHWFDPK